MTRGEAIKFVVVRSLGNFLVLFAIYGVVATFGPVLFLEVRFRVDEWRGVKYEISKIKDQRSKPGIERQILYENSLDDGEKRGFGEILAGQRERVLIPKDTDFGILIPRIGASAKVFANVDPNDEKGFLPVLSEGIAHAKGSVFPGMVGNVYLFAHSTDNWWNVGRYNAVFYLLKDLKEGDEVVVFFEGRRYDYRVAYSVIAEPDNVGYLTAAHAGEERLVLQTCWPPGTNWKRLFVVARPVNQYGKNLL